MQLLRDVQKSVARGELLLANPDGPQMLRELGPGERVRGRVAGVTCGEVEERVFLALEGTGGYVYLIPETPEMEQRRREGDLQRGTIVTLERRSSERAALRAEQSKPLLDEIRTWLMTPRALPRSVLGKAIAYTSGLWPGLVRFLADSKIPLDTNSVERAARGVSVGRKNHYGSRSERGTRVAALFYSLHLDLGTATMRESTKTCR